MTCATSISSFINQSIGSYTIQQYAEWASWETYNNTAIVGELPVAFFVLHWGLESLWGGADISVHYNPANQGGTCGYTKCGTYSSNPTLPAFCNISDGMHSYINLMMNGYPHVPWAYGAGTLSTAATALGQGYYTDYLGSATSYCAAQSYALNSPSTLRLWATSEYKDGSTGVPGSQFTDTYNANTCIQSLDYIQTTNPLPGF